MEVNKQLYRLYSMSYKVPLQAGSIIGISIKKLMDKGRENHTKSCDDFRELSSRFY